MRVGEFWGCGEERKHPERIGEVGSLGEWVEQGLRRRNKIKLIQRSQQINRDGSEKEMQSQQDNGSLCQGGSYLNRHR